MTWQERGGSPGHHSTPLPPLDDGYCSLLSPSFSPRSVIINGSNLQSSSNIPLTPLSLSVFCLAGRHCKLLRVSWMGQLARHSQAHGQLLLSELRFSMTNLTLMQVKFSVDAPLAEVDIFGHFLEFIEVKPCGAYETGFGAFWWYKNRCGDNNGKRFVGGMGTVVILSWP